MRRNFAIIFGTAFLIRLLFLNQSLWLDEAITAKVIRTLGLMEISSRFSPADFHPPLYYIFMKMWSLLFGTGEVALRLPSVIFSLLTGHAVFLIGSRIKSERFGLFAAALYLFNPLVIYYSQEARMYALSTMLCTFALYFLLNIVVEEKPEHRGFLHRAGKALNIIREYFRKRPIKMPEDNPTLLLFLKGEHLSLVMLNILFVLAVWTHYVSYFFVAAALLLFIVRKKYQDFAVTTVIMLLSFAVQYPLLNQQILHAQDSLVKVPFWRNALGTVSLKNFMLIFIKFAFGRISFTPKLLYYIVAGLWTIFIFLFVALGSLKDRRLFLFFTVPLALGILFSFFTPMLQYFRFLFLLPVMSILIMVGIENYVKVKKKKGLFAFFRREKSKKLIDYLKENAVVEIILGVYLFLSIITLTNPGLRREDWRSLARSLPSGAPVYIISSSSDALTYYAQDAHLKDLKSIGGEWLFERRVIIIPYTAEIYGLNYEDPLRKMGCFKRESKNFNGGIFYEEWDCGRTG